jgi:NAD(P)-dependent dehydrogenase (short-subunit alcohol dehydrogenase family)
MSTAIVIGISSDIGRELAQRFAADGWAIAGTYRSRHGLDTLLPTAELVQCDLASRTSVAAAAEWLGSRCREWDALIIAAGTEEPIGTFWECDPDEWDRGIEINALSPLRLVRRLYPLRARTPTPSVVFFSGAGTNSSAPAYSAYCASKILLIKMCELLDAESSDTSFFIVGPGIVRTRIHEQTLKAAERSGANYQKVVKFLESPDQGTGHDEIYSCIRWGMAAGKPATGGRNLSLVNDAWRGGGAALARWLEANPNAYKLRRLGNDQRIGNP